MRLDPDDLAEQVRAYYRARGWADDGVPLPETISRLGLEQYR
jgi:aldehyde:ferredoxin oxidoreductase